MNKPIPARKRSEHRPERPIATNREARFHYEILDRWEAGLVLTGSEMKSMRKAAVNLKEGHVRIDADEAWLVSVNVSPYENAGYAQHEPLRKRKLLLHRVEIDKMRRSVEKAGLAIVPLRLYFSGSKVKVEIGLGRGKKLHDKRESIKKRDQDRDLRARMKR